MYDKKLGLSQILWSCKYRYGLQYFGRQFLSLLETMTTIQNKKKNLGLRIVKEEEHNQMTPLFNEVRFGLAQMQSLWEYWAFYPSFISLWVLFQWKLYKNGNKLPTSLIIELSSTSVTNSSRDRVASLVIIEPPEVPSTYPWSRAE